MFVLAELPCPCEHTINLEKSDVFCTKKCGRLHLKPLPSCPQNVRTKQPTPPLYLTADVFYGQLQIKISTKHYQEVTFWQRAVAVI